MARRRRRRRLPWALAALGAVLVAAVGWFWLGWRAHRTLPVPGYAIDGAADRETAPPSAEAKSGREDIRESDRRALERILEQKRDR